jgi:hypothetical protein
MPPNGDSLVDIAGRRDLRSALPCTISDPAIVPQAQRNLSYGREGGPR